MRKRLLELFRWVDPGPHSTHLVSDGSGWWRAPDVLAAVGPALADLFRAERPTVVLAPETTGLLLGPLVAVALQAGFVPAVKEGDRAVAEAMSWARTAPDYRGRTLALGVRRRHLHPDDRVLVVDDWVATGAQVRTLYELVRVHGARAVGAASIVAACSPGTTAELDLRCLLTPDDLEG